MLRFLTAGESHGPALTAILEGMVAGVPISEKEIRAELTRRRHGYGRGTRMKLEEDRLEILVRHGQVQEVEPTAQVGEPGTPSREDEVTNRPAPDEMLANAPAREGNFFKVPRIIE